MATGVSNSDLIELQKVTLANLPKQEFEVALQQQEYHVVNKWFKEDKKTTEKATRKGRKPKAPQEIKTEYVGAVEIIEPKEEDDVKVLDFA